MKIYIQWTTDPAQDWVEIDSSQWEALRKKPVPVGGEIIDGTFGWITAVNVMGNVFEHHDNITVIPLPSTGPADPILKVVCWSDDPDDYPVGEFAAYEWTFWDIQPDIRAEYGGAMNTRSQVKAFCGSSKMKWWRDTTNLNVQNWTFSPYSNFIKPADPSIIRHGKWMDDVLMADHQLIRSKHGWREWGSGGDVPQQRPLGNYEKPKGTRTYFIHNVIRANTIHGSVPEHSFELTADDGSTQNQDIFAETQGLRFLFNTSNEPDNGTWPDGVYRFQFDISSLGNNITFGLLTLGSALGHFGRVNDARDTEIDSKVQSQGAFSSTGLSMATVDTTGDSWGGSNQSDGFEVNNAMANSAMHGSEGLELTYDADAFADGPWAAAGGVVEVPLLMAQYQPG